MDASNIIDYSSLIGRAANRGFSINEQLHAFRNQIARFAKLDIDDEQVLKQVLHRLITRIEVNEDGMINAIHYNITCPQSVRARKKRGA